MWNLPRGRHARAPDVVAERQRDRVMAAFAELVAARGLGAVSVGDVVARATVSRSAFYANFDDLLDCADAAYARFISVLLVRITEAMDPGAPWQDFVDAALHAYLGALQSDLVVARAMQLELDAAGRPARERRNAALRQLAGVLEAHHGRARRLDPAMGELPSQAFLAIVYAVDSWRATRCKRTVR